ncbi:uncharacterized protein LOC108908199 [Anoplophora glabripennis]|uniref:uncharacterized protein LOC108908199 n=1 Tax=Anoplophora glabripennis TaxID=217634 RepID=UPI0008754C28|nr:uncharacterized protein LOC108908199 [Anoplophora glabripennis]
MPPPAKRDCGIILFDINASNKNEALAALMKISTFIWLSDTKDTYRLILSNTKESKNIKKYKNLYDSNLSDSDPQPILSCIENAKPEEGNWYDALLLAIAHLKEAYELSGVITLQILYMTKLDGCSQDVDMNKVERIINDLREYNIFLYIIGPDVKLPFTITRDSDVSDAMKDISVDESNPSLSMAKRIVDATTNTVLCDLKVGINLFFSFRNPRGTQPWKVPLSFGSRFEIPACTVKIYKRDAPFKLTTNSRNSKFVLLEDESVSVDISDLTSGIERHGKFVKVNEREMFKVEGPRSFAVTGFTHKKYIPEYYIREGAFYVLPDADKLDDCSQILYDLIDELAEQEKYVVMRRVYNANNKPKFFVLVPQPDLQPKCFVMSELPYADDLKQNFKCTEPVLTEKVEDDTFEQFFNSIDIWNDNCKLSIPLGPKMMLEIYSSKLANAVAKQYLEQDFSFEELDVDDLENETNDSLEALKASWPENDKPNEDEEECT